MWYVDRNTTVGGKWPKWSKTVCNSKWNSLRQSGPTHGKVTINCTQNYPKGLELGSRGVENRGAGRGVNGRS